MQVVGLEVALRCAHKPRQVTQDPPVHQPKYLHSEGEREGVLLMGLFTCLLIGLFVCLSIYLSISKLRLIVTIAIHCFCRFLFICLFSFCYLRQIFKLPCSIILFLTLSSYSVSAYLANCDIFPVLHPYTVSPMMLLP